MARFKVHREPRRRGGSFAPVRRQEVAVGMKFGSLTVVACVGVLFCGQSARMPRQQGDRLGHHRKMPAGGF
jgi:hypothetical protein